jgi:hypothetical protein
MPVSAYLAIKHPRGREHKWDVAHHVDHRRPVDGTITDVVIMCHDVGNNGVLEPVHGIGCRAQYEYCQHQPPPSVLPTLALGCSVLLRHRSACRHVGTTVIAASDSLEITN